MEQVRDILLPLRCECLLVPGATAEGDDDYLPLLCRIRSAHKRTGADQRSGQRHSRRTAQEVTPGAAKMHGELSAE